MTVFGFGESDARDIVAATRRMLGETVGDGFAAHESAHPPAGSIIVEVTETVAAGGLTQARQVRLESGEFLKRVAVRAAATVDGTAEIPIRAVAVPISNTGFVAVPIGPIDGSGSGSGNDCCCCESVAYPDTILPDGTGTTRLRELCRDLQPISQIQQHGILTVTFPPKSQMRLAKDPMSDEFSWDIPLTAFSAIYDDNTDATGDLIAPSGSVILTPKVDGSGYCLCPKTRLRIEADADIPEQVV